MMASKLFKVVYLQGTRVIFLFHNADFMNFYLLPIEKLSFFYLDIYTPIDYLSVPS